MGDGVPEGFVGVAFGDPTVRVMKRQSMGQVDFGFGMAWWKGGPELMLAWRRGVLGVNGV